MKNATIIILNTSGSLCTVGESHVPRPLPEDVERMTADQKRRYEIRLSQAHGAVSIPPGSCEVDAEDWRRITHADFGNKIVKHLMAQGLLKEAPRQAATLRGVASADEAIKLVRSCGDADLLTRWKDDEKRRKVLEALDTQIAEVTRLRALAVAEDSAT